MGRRVKKYSKRIGEYLGELRKKEIHDDNVANELYDKMLILWEEDDACVPDRERVGPAFYRISNINPQLKGYYDVITVDLGSITFEIYDGGWVKGYADGLGFVGVLVEVTDN